MRMYFYCQDLMPMYASFAGINLEEPTLDCFKEKIMPIFKDWPKIFTSNFSGPPRTWNYGFEDVDKFVLRFKDLIPFNDTSERELLFDLVGYSEIQVNGYRHIVNRYNDLAFYLFDEHHVNWLPDKKGKFLPVNSKENAKRIGIEWIPETLDLYKVRGPVKLQKEDNEYVKINSDGSIKEINL